MERFTHSPSALSMQRASLLRYLAYPGLLIGNGCVAAYALSEALPLPMVNFLALIGSFAYLALMERIIPYDTSWHPTAREWMRDGVYFTQIVGVGAVGGACVSALTVYLAPAESSFPLGLEVLVALLASTFMGYWFHRITHMQGWLWKIHGVHHTPKKVNLANNNVIHFLDVFVPAVITQIPLLLMGISETAVFIVTIFVTAQGYGVHSNIDVKIGWLNYLISSPELHRLHHSVDVKEAGHYGADLSIWDLMFGSFTWHPGKKPVGIGILEPNQFPSPNAMVASAVFPFRRSRHGHSNAESRL